MSAQKERHTIIGGDYLLQQFPEDKNAEFQVLDCTYGKGLHARLIMEHYPNSKFIAFDYDNKNLNNKDTDRIKFIHSNFIKAGDYLKNNKIRVDFIMIDLGAHMDQILDPAYGLSFMYLSANIDMRINNSEPIKCAKTVLNQYNFDQIANIMHYYGNLNNYLKVANDIINYRKNHKFETISDIYSALGLNYNANKSYLAKIFQAIRVEVNEDIKNLLLFLVNLPKCIVCGNQSLKLITFTFHSLEDKIIKNFLTGKNINHGLEDMFNKMNLINYKLIKEPVRLVFGKCDKKIYKGDANRRKDLFFIIRSCLIKLPADSEFNI